MKRSVSLIIPLVLGLTLLYLLYFHFFVGLHRFFDVDEFSYLHWIAKFARGERPYVDFFLFIPPAFLMFFAPLFLFFHDASVFYAARVVSFLIFGGLTATLIYLFFLTRSKKWALLPAVFLAFLPMPFDKFLEVRPDNLSTLIAVVGMVLLVVGIQGNVRHKYLFGWSGASYAISLLVFPKTLPGVVVGILILLLYVWYERNIRILKEGILGFLIPFVLFGLWAATLGNMSTVWYSLTALPFEANRLFNFYVMESHLFFFPNFSFYGGTGITPSLIFNHAIWVLGVIVLAIRFFVPFVTAKGDRRGVLIELLVSATALFYIYLYVAVYPVKHSQYLVPIAFFVSFYAADGLRLVFDAVERVGGWIIGTGAVVVVCVVLLGVSQQATVTKLTLPNTTQIEELHRLEQLIPKKDLVMDFDGRMLSWRDPYYICCLSLGEFTQFLSHPLPPLWQVLEEKKVPYIFQGDSNRMSRLSGADLDYINVHYVPAQGWGTGLWIRKGLGQ